MAEWTNATAWPPPLAGSRRIGGKSREFLKIMRYTVYIIQSTKTHQYYIGMSRDLQKRLKAHNKNSGRFTKNKGPWRLVYKEVFPDKRLAWLRERQLKRYKGGEAFKRLINQYRRGG